MDASLKNRLIKKELTIGGWLTISHATIAEIMARSGFDWLAVDMEHGTMGTGECQEMIRTIDLCGIPALVRVGENQPLLIARAMDSGASGVIVPRVNSASEAVRAVEAVKYPPKGKRGVGLSRAQDYGFRFEEYREWQEKNSVVIVQIEHIDAVKNLPEILKTPGIDGCLVGPYDISASLGLPGALDHPRVLEALVEIRQVASRFPLSIGFHVVAPDPLKVLEKIREGFTLVAYSTDFLLLGSQSREGIRQIRNGLGS